MSDYPCTCRSSVVCLSCEAAWNARWTRCHDDLMELGRINGTAEARQLDAAERERDEARAEIARLTAEVERLRAERFRAQLDAVRAAWGGMRREVMGNGTHITKGYGRSMDAALDGEEVGE